MVHRKTIYIFSILTAEAVDKFEAKEQKFMFYPIKKTIQRVGMIKRHHAMRQFILKALFIVLPLLLVLGYIEYRLSMVTVSYSQKKYELETQLDQIEVLALGSSNGYFALNPHFFSKKGFNLAYRAQWPFYDLKFIEKYLNRMPRLKLVIYPVNYFTLGTQASEQADEWRILFYSQYHHFLPPKTGKYAKMNWLFEPRLFSKIALFGERIPYYLRHGSTQINSGEPDEDMTGWLNAGTKPCDLTQNIGFTGATAHNLGVDPRNFKLNLKIISHIVKKLQAKNIDFYILELPELAYYTDHLDPVKTAAMEQSIRDFAKKNHVKFINYLNDKRFTVNDFTDMPDHLNANGAEKISRTIDHDIIIPTFKARA